MLPTSSEIRRKDDPRWVSKTDLIRYARCPYAFWLLDRGEITFEDSLGPGGIDLVQEGVAFQAGVEAAAMPLAIPPENLPEFMRETDRTLLGTPGFENPELQIYGRPDGLDSRGGIIRPIEIKSHKDVYRSDELELAFYWLLLAPYQEGAEANPSGVLYLRRGGRAERVELRISELRLRQVHGLLEEIRRAREIGVRVRICGCPVCRGLRREEVLASAHAQGDLTLILGIGRSYATALEEAGIGDLEQLLEARPVALVRVLREKGLFVSREEVGRWRRHAHSWKDLRPIRIGRRLGIGNRFLALDAEYDEDSIWLLGWCVVDGDSREYSSRWIEEPSQERRALRDLAKAFAAAPDQPVLTWAGTSADVPQLRNAARRLRLGRLLEPLFERHVDVYDYARKSVRLPTTGLRLKEVASYFGSIRLSGIESGRHATSLHEALSSIGQKRPGLDEHIRQLLVEYNREDVESLVDVTLALVRLPSARAGRSRRPLPRTESGNRVPVTSG